MDTSDARNQSVIKAVEWLKSCQFKTTGIKVELEAQLNRGYRGSCDYCEERTVYCEYCSDGYQECYECSGTGTTQDSDGEEIDCGQCDEGQRECNDCEGDNSWDCEDCGGDWSGSDGGWGDNRACHNWILERLSEFGLAEQDGSNWKPKHPLVFSRFYNDGSVDSEFTFTLSMDNPENVLLLPKIVEVFNDFGAEVGHMDVRGAGMHMALLNDPDCYYGSDVGTTSANLSRFGNFKKSMILLMPALFFLGSHNEKSRQLGYRRPVLGGTNIDGNKYGAISFNYGAIEFRVFETCYDNPKAILDNVMVMRKCMKYWTTKYTRNNLDKIANNVPFGIDVGDKLARLFVMSEHIDLLNRGLALLKPDYYTIKELKKQRGFTVTKRDTNGREKRIRKEAVVEYKEYQERFGWNLVISKNSFIARELQTMMNTGRVLGKDQSEIMKQVEAKAEEDYKKRQAELKSIDKYTEERVKTEMGKSCGNWKLAV